MSDKSQDWHAVIPIRLCFAIQGTHWQLMQFDVSTSCLYLFYSWHRQVSTLRHEQAETAVESVVFCWDVWLSRGKWQICWYVWFYLMWVPPVNIFVTGAEGLHRYDTTTSRTLSPLNHHPSLLISPPSSSSSAWLHWPEQWISLNLLSFSLCACVFL
jgi:hypothetical protein